MRKTVYIKNSVEKQKIIAFDPAVEDKMRILANYLIDCFLDKGRKKGLKETIKSNTLIMEHR